MLKRLTIRRFKSIYESTIEFGRSNLFIGINGAGKSNVLEALGVLSAALSRGLEPNELNNRGVRLSLAHMFKSSFKYTDLSPQFRFEAEFENGRYSCSIRASAQRGFLEFHSEELYDGNNKVFGRGPNGVLINERFVQGATSFSEHAVASHRSLWDVLSPFSTISEAFRAELTEFSRFVIYSPQTALMRGIASDARVTEPLGLTGGGLAAAFSDALAQRDKLSSDELKRFEDILSLIWATGWANRIAVGPFDYNVVPSQVSSSGSVLYIRDKYMKNNRNFLSAFDASEGTLYLIFVVTVLLHEGTPNTFALDNVDGTLNADLVRKLADTLVKTCSQTGPSSRRTYQAFVTSHHPSSLDSFDLFSEDQRVFVARRRAEGGPVGATYFDRLQPPAGMAKQDWIQAHGGKNLSELLLEGLIPGALR